MRYFIIIILGLLLLSIVSCSDDDNDVIPETKRIAKIERLNAWGEYKLFSYDQNGALYSIEEGDEYGMKQKILLSYKEERISTLELFDPNLSSKVDMKYKEDTAFIFGFHNSRRNGISSGKINDTLIIDTSHNTLRTLTNIYSYTYTYNYDDKGNVRSVSSWPGDYIDYDTNPSFYSTTQAPFWFLNYLRESYSYYEYMRVFAGTNNQIQWSFDYAWQYLYKYDSDGYPVHISIYHPLEDLYSEFDIKYEYIYNQKMD